MHGSLGDTTLLRFARKSSYGYFSALGMFIGHYLAWICAAMSAQVYLGGDLNWFRTWLIVPTLIYFISATAWIVQKEKQAELKKG